MTLLRPWWLMGLWPVAAAALWALWRPGRQLIVVASTDLWQQAFAALSPSQRRATRRLSASWWCLLVGALLAVLALARPILTRQAPQRRVGVVVVPSAETANSNGLPPVEAAKVLVGRLGEADRVQLLLPAILGGASDWLTPQQVEQRLVEANVLPATADALSVPAASSDAQAVYMFVPVTFEASGGPQQSIFLASGSSNGPRFVDARTARSGRVRMMLSGEPAEDDRAVQVEAVGTGGRSAGRLELPWPRLKMTVTAEVAAAEAYALSMIDDSHRPAIIGRQAWLARQPREPIRVALIGRDAGMLRRYVEADTLLEPVAGPDDADVVVAVGADAPSGRPVLRIDPSGAPAGWRRGDRRQAVTLDAADIAADDPLMRNVDVDGMAVRRVTPWIPGDVAAGRAVMLLDGEAVAVRSSEAPPAGGPRWAAIAFDISPENTNLAVSDAFLVLLANAVRWLAGDARASGDYAAVRPIEAADWQAWQCIDGGRPDDIAAGPLPWPGLYRDAAGRLVAVNLLDERGWPDRAISLDALRAAPLPEPVAAEANVTLWPWLAGLAGAFWMLGWWVRIQ
ncbi:MAG: hypothetical protein GVY16_08085 [Planctomycetes bacterium]|jgi:hypothetical protein|nr:hypothetical protein [Planctomycetota bacterium]